MHERTVQTMTINYNITGKDRKALVNAISEITGAETKYLGMPTAAYQIDYFTVTKEGALEFDDRADSEEIENLLESLAEKGFIAENAATTDNNPSEAEPLTQGDSAGFTVEIPLKQVNIENLKILLSAKGTLIKKALGAERLTIEVKEDRVSFPWFPEISDSDAVKAYTHFISAFCKMSVELKRVNMREKQTENEKYAFRCFLLRLGFIGEEFKAERKILLKNLTGSPAFKRGERNESKD